MKNCLKEYGINFLKEYGITIFTAVMVTISSIVVIWAALDIRTVIVTTKPDIKTTAWVMFMETSGEGRVDLKDNFILYYYNEETIEYFEIDINIFNIGSGVAYDFDVKLSLPQLKYSQTDENEGVSIYVDGESRGTIYQWTDTFHYPNNILAPQGGKTTLELNIPFGAIGSIENLPEKCTITITDIDNKMILERTWGLNYDQKPRWREV